MRAFRLIFCLALAMLFAGNALAQFTLRSGIGGVITDSSGAVVVNATVVLTDLDRNQTTKTTTNEGGLYTFVNLTPGRYQVSVEQTGFRKSVSDPVAVSGRQTARVDLALAVGALSETVEVKGVSPLLQTEQTVVGQMVDRNLVESLPAQGRNFTNLVMLAAGVTTSNVGTTVTPLWGTAGVQMGISGMTMTVGGGGSDGAYMNGVNINDDWGGVTNYMPSMEAVGEVTIDVANYSAANGRDVSNMTITTRGGTSTYHGTGFDYFVNSALNAWNPYTKTRMSPGQKKSLLQRNQFGGNFGGPVVIPKAFNGRDKLFFFANYEGLKQNQGGVSLLYRVPTQAQRTGDFSEVLRRFPGDVNYLIYDPYSTVIDAKGNSKRTPIPNNDLRGKMDSRAVEMLGLWPAPNEFDE